MKMSLAAFVRNKTAPTDWRTELLEVDIADVDPFYAHAVCCEGQPVGVVTSGAYGHRTGKSLALAYLRDPAATDGLTINILGDQRPAHILTRPPFDPENIRLRSKGAGK